MKFTFRDLIRHSDQKAEGYSRALQAARVRAAYQRSYFAPALFRLIPVATDLIDSMAVDAQWRLYYNDVWVARHTVEENATLLIHEVGHLLRDHEARKKAAGITDHRRWTLVVGQGVPSVPATPAQPPANRPAPPVRDPRTPGYVTATNATELADGAVPPVTATGNFILGPTHTPAAEVSVQTGVPRGAVHTFTMNSADSKIYPGIARAEGTRPMVDPTDPARRIVTSGPAAYTRRVAVYVPQQIHPRRHRSLHRRRRWA